MVVYICVLLQKSPPPRHRMLLCLRATLSVCLLRKGQRMAVPKTPLILYPHIQSACLIGEHLGVEKGQTADTRLHFAIIFLAILFSNVTGTLPVIPIAKVTLFQHIVSTKMHTHKTHI